MARAWNLLRKLTGLVRAVASTSTPKPGTSVPKKPTTTAGKPGAPRPGTSGKPGTGSPAAGKPGAGKPGIGGTRTSRPTATTRPSADEPYLESPGQFGPSATVEVDAASIGQVRMTYQPDRDGDPDPGEIVWTWVPFEENDGRGKDRPVLIVAAEPTGTVLAVQLTSKSHNGDAEFVPVGSGSWDSQGRPSWVNLDRVFRVHPDGMRRESDALPKGKFDGVAARLRERYGWR